MPKSHSYFFVQNFQRNNINLDVKTSTTFCVKISEKCKKLIWLMVSLLEKQKLLSIAPISYKHIFQTVIREKLSKALLYENGTHKLLIKLTYCQLLWNLENPILVDIAELKF